MANSSNQATAIIIHGHSAFLSLTPPQCQRQMGAKGLLSLK